jgi:hypothetical protein
MRPAPGSPVEANQTARELQMKTFTIIYAQDVPHYGSVELEAESDAEILEAARAFWESTELDPAYDPDWESSVCKRIVEITDETGKTIAHDVRLDSYYLDTASDEEVTIRKHARRLLEALERAHVLLDRISDTLHYEDGLPVTALESRDIEIIYGDAVTELAPIETLIRQARGLS